MIEVPYTTQGYIDIEAVSKLTASTPFVFIIGSRQCGKTYGVTRYALDRRQRMVIVRRTKDERLKFANEQTTPLQRIDRTVTGIAAGDLVTLRYKDPEAADGLGDTAGWVLDLNTARKRGFALPEFDTVIYDECVPEQHAGGRQDQQHAETFFQLLVTLFGDNERFYSAEQHPKVWILGNSNSIDAWVFRTFGVTQTIERMLRTGSQVYISPQRAVSVILASAPEHAAARAEMPLLRVAERSAARDMVTDNKFVGDTLGIRGWPLREFKALASFYDPYASFTIWLHKKRGEPIIYVTRGAYPAKHNMPNTHEAFVQLGKQTAFKSRREFWYAVLHALSGNSAWYDSLQSKQWFLRMRKGN